MFLTFAGETIEVGDTSGMYESASFRIHLLEQSQDQWVCTIHIHRGSYETSAQNDTPESTPQAALDAAATFWMAERDGEVADDVDAINDVRTKIADHVEAL
jgi:hypothetical protein